MTATKEKLLPCPIPRCGGEAELTEPDAQGDRVVCTHCSLELNRDDWQSIVRPNRFYYDTVDEMRKCADTPGTTDYTIYQRKIREWADYFEATPELKPWEAVQQIAKELRTWEYKDAALECDDVDYFCKKLEAIPEPKKEVCDCEGKCESDCDLKVEHRYCEPCYQDAMAETFEAGEEKAKKVLTRPPTDVWAVKSSVHNGSFLTENIAVYATEEEATNNKLSKEDRIVRYEIKSDSVASSKESAEPCKQCGFVDTSGIRCKCDGTTYNLTGWKARQAEMKTEKGRSDYLKIKALQRSVLDLREDFKEEETRSKEWAERYIQAMAANEGLESIIGELRQKVEDAEADRDRQIGEAHIEFQELLEAGIRGAIEVRKGVEKERDTHAKKCREAAQTLIEEIGAPGPENVEETAKRAVMLIQNRKQSNRVLNKEVDRLKNKLCETQRIADSPMICVCGTEVTLCPVCDKEINPPGSYDVLKEGTAFKYEVLSEPGEKPKPTFNHLKKAREYFAGIGRNPDTQTMGLLIRTMGSMLEYLEEKAKK